MQQETPPPFYSRSQRHTRPARRRPENALPDLTRFRRQLNRSTVVLGAFIVLIIAGSTALARSRSQPSEAPTAPPAAGAPVQAIGVDVTHVVDGDTLDVRAAETPLRVRLYGVDTPERGEPCFDQATARLTALAGRRVYLVPDARARDQYGRELRYVFTNDGHSIDAALVSEGLARAWREDGSRRDALVALEDAARASTTGCLWTKR